MARPELDGNGLARSRVRSAFGDRVLFVFALPAWADPAAVLALGDGLVASEPSAAIRPAGSTPTVPGGWVPVLADCLEERAPRRFMVIDRVRPGETLATARQTASGVAELAPAVVVVALGETAADGASRAALDGLLSDLAGRGEPRVLLVPPVPPGIADPAVRAQVDARVAAYDRLLGEAAKGRPSVRRLDVLADWPKGAEARAALVGGGALSDQGHARIAAAVCDAILAP